MGNIGDTHDNIIKLLLNFIQFLFADVLRKLSKMKAQLCQLLGIMFKSACGIAIQSHFVFKLLV